VAIYSTFLQRAYDQIVHDVCLQHLPVVFALDRAGLVGGRRADSPRRVRCILLRHIPGLCVMAPKDPDELRRMIATAWNTTAIGDPLSARRVLDDLEAS